MESFNREMYNEDSLCRAMDMHYIPIPIEGKQGYTPEKLEAFTSVLEQYPGRVFIHCYSGYRVTYLMMAWLIVHERFCVEDVVRFGKQMAYFSPLEGLLGVDLKIALPSTDPEQR